MILKSFFFPFGPLEVNIFLLADEETRQALIVDAGVYDESVLEFAREEGLKLDTALITHIHKDHIDGLGAYMKNGIGRVISPAPLAAAPSAEIVSHGERVTAAGFDFLILRSSGHTPESISYYCRSEDICFVGDALFAGAVGGTSDDKQHAEEIQNIKLNLLTLPAETRLYSGHGPATNIAIEKAANPFLQPGFTRLP